MRTLLKAIWALAVMAAIASLVALGHPPGGTEGGPTATMPDYSVRYDQNRETLEYDVRESGQTMIGDTRFAY